MVVGQTLKKYWPWLIAFAFLIGYEVYALSTPGTHTLSEMVWQAEAAFPPLTAIVTTIVAILLYHFFLQRRHQ